MSIMRKSIMRIKLASILFLLLILVSFSYSQVLVNTSIDKENITKNEIARLNIKIFNDSQISLKNYSIRIEVTDNLVLTKTNQRIYAEIIDEIKIGETKELTYFFKPISTTPNIGKVFVYYGENKEYVSGTFVNLINSPILFKTGARKIFDNSGEKIIIDFEVFNYSKERIFDLGGEVIAPNGFVVQTEGFMIPYLDDNNSLKKSFEILAPLGAVGEQEIILAYGYFDNNSPHYFEETHLVSFENNNRFFLAGVGIIVLIIAIFIYLSKTSKTPKDNIKGTSEK